MNFLCWQGCNTDGYVNFYDLIRLIRLGANVQTFRIVKSFFQILTLDHTKKVPYRGPLTHVCSMHRDDSACV